MNFKTAVSCTTNLMEKVGEGISSHYILAGPRSFPICLLAVCKPFSSTSHTTVWVMSCGVSESVCYKR